MPKRYVVSYIVLFRSQVNCAVWVALKLAAYSRLIQIFLKECTIVLPTLREIKTLLYFWTIYPYCNCSFSRSQVIFLLLNSITTFVFLTPNSFLQSWLSLHSGNKFLSWLLGQTSLGFSVSFLASPGTLSQFPFLSLFPLTYHWGLDFFRTRSWIDSLLCPLIALSGLTPSQESR